MSTVVLDAPRTATHQLDGHSLSIEELVRIARDREPLAIHPLS